MLTNYILLRLSSMTIIDPLKGYKSGWRRGYVRLLWQISFVDESTIITMIMTEHYDVELLLLLLQTFWGRWGWIDGWWWRHDRSTTCARPTVGSESRAGYHAPLINHFKNRCGNNKVLLKSERNDTLIYIPVERRSYKSAVTGKSRFRRNLR